MTGKVLIVVGMGPKIGMSIARRFGREGYKVGMIARSAEKLEGYARELQAEGVETASAVADVLDRKALTAGIETLKETFGRVDVLEYSPLLNMYGLVDVLELNPETALEQVEFQLLGAIASAKAVMDEMVERGDGALLFTTGASAYLPAPSHANGSIAVAALRHYVITLYVALKSRGVYVGSVSIGRPFEGDEVADAYWDLMRTRDKCEVLLGDPRLMAVYDELVTAGYGEGYPARLTKPLPTPADERERHLHLVSLFHISSVMRALAPDEKEQRRIEALVLERGGQIDVPLYGGNLDLVAPYPSLR